MKRLILYIFALVVAVSFTGCNKHHIKKFRVHKETVEKVLVYRVPVKTTNNVAKAQSQGVASTDTDDQTWLYWYIIYNQNNTECVYAKSTTPITSGGYSSLTWQSSKGLPPDLEEDIPTATQSTLQIPDADLGKDAVQEITQESTQIETVDVDAEPGAGYVNQDGMTSSLESETTTTDTGATDAGGTDAGGNDAGGGGDTGGGGDSGGGSE